MYILKQSGLCTNVSSPLRIYHIKRPKKNGCCHYNVRGRPALGKEDAFLFAETIGVSGGVGFPLSFMTPYPALGSAAAVLLRL